MTLKEIVERIFIGLGEPSDLQIYTLDTTTVDTTASGWKLLVDVVNQSLLELCTWKFPDGRQLRLRMHDSAALFETKVVTGTITGTPSVGLMDVLGLANGVNVYKDCLVIGQTGGATGVVIASNGTGGTTTIYLMKTSGVFVPGETIKIHRRTYVWNPVGSVPNPVLQDGIPYQVASGKPLEIISVVDTETETTLSTTTKSETFSVVSSTTGTPGVFVKIPSGVRLDVFPDANRIYLVRYMRGPAQLGYTDLDLEPELPPQFHRALELMGLYWGYRRAQESTDAYSVKRDLYDFLRSVRTEYDLQDELAVGQIKFYPEGR